MIVCKKCGEKYEDDMPRCLWCDAPNPEHPLNKVKAPVTAVPAPAPASPDVADSVAEQPIAEQPVDEPAAPAAPSATETSPNAAVIEIEQDLDTVIEQQFHQKGFLWSVVLAGVFVSWLCHYKYLKKGDKFGTQFFLSLFGIECMSQSLFYMLAKANYSGLAFGPFLHFVITIIVCLLYWFFIGKLGFALLKKAVPNYDSTAFKKRERVGIIIGIPIFALDFIAGYLQYGTTAKMLGVWIGRALQ